MIISSVTFDQADVGAVQPVNSADAGEKVKSLEQDYNRAVGEAVQALAKVFTAGEKMTRAFLDCRQICEANEIANPLHPPQRVANMWLSDFANLFLWTLEQGHPGEYKQVDCPNYLGRSAVMASLLNRFCRNDKSFNAYLKDGKPLPGNG